MCRRDDYPPYGPGKAFNPYAGMELEEDKEEDPDITIKLSTLERWHDSIILGSDATGNCVESESYLQTLDEMLELREKYNVV